VARADASVERAAPGLVTGDANARRAVASSCEAGASLVRRDADVVAAGVTSVRLGAIPPGPVSAGLA